MMDNCDNDPATLQAALEARAAENAKTVEGWNVEKQRQYEAFMEAEFEAKEALRTADLQRTNPNWHPQPDLEVKKIDPWEAILVNVKGELFHGEERIHSQELMTETLGIVASDQSSAVQRRLAECMRALRWLGPKPLRIHSRFGRGFWRPVADTHNASADND